MVSEPKRIISPNDSPSLGSTPYRSSVVTKPLVETIVPLLDQNNRPILSNYLDAWNLSGGKLPPNNLFHEYFVLTHRWMKLPRHCEMWAKELLVYPAKYEVFRSEANFTDPHSAWSIKWDDLVKLLPPSEFVNIQNMGLFVTPKSFEFNNGNLIIVPDSIVPLVGLARGNARMCRSGLSEDWGKFDPRTKIPLQVLPGDFELLSSEDRGYLQTTDYASISPIVRGDRVRGGFSVIANGIVSSICGVATVEMR